MSQDQDRRQTSSCRDDASKVEDESTATSGMTAFIHEATGTNIERVEESFGNGYVRLRSEEAERRQAKHDIRHVEDIVLEMMRNSRDAGARVIFIATTRSDNLRRLCVIDDGCGIPRNMWNRVFEARVTTKLDSMRMDPWGIHGRGMALYAIKANARDARIQDSVIDGGSSIVVDVDTDDLQEKRDQSSFPRFFVTDSGVIEARGPRNIARCVAEFAFRERERCMLYVGSDAQIASTLYAYGKACTTASQRAFSSGEGVGVCKRLAFANDPESFAALAASIGLVLSERTARRVMNGEIQQLADSASLVERELNSAMNRSNDRTSKAKADRGVSIGSSTPHVRLSEGDRRAFQEGIERAYADLAEKYYLSAHVEPRISLRNSEITIHIPLRRDDE